MLHMCVCVCVCITVNIIPLKVTTFIIRFAGITLYFIKLSYNQECQRKYDIFNTTKNY